MTVVTGGVRGGFGRSAEETGRRGTGWKVLADAVLLGRDEAGDCGPLEVAVCAGSMMDHKRANQCCGKGLWEPMLTDLGFAAAAGVYESGAGRARL